MATRNGNRELQQTMQQLALAQAQLIAAQATMANTMTTFLERMAVVEADFDWIKKTLVRHEQMLQALPETIRQKIGFNKEGEAR